MEAFPDRPPSFSEHRPHHCPGGQSHLAHPQNISSDDSGGQPAPAGWGVPASNRNSGNTEATPETSWLLGLPILSGAVSVPLSHVFMSLHQNASSLSIPTGQQRLHCGGKPVSQQHCRLSKPCTPLRRSWGGGLTTIQRGHPTCKEAVVVNLKSQLDEVWKTLGRCRLACL